METGKVSLPNPNNGSRTEAFRGREATLPAVTHPAWPFPAVRSRFAEAHVSLRPNYSRHSRRHSRIMSFSPIPVNQLVNSTNRIVFPALRSTPAPTNLSPSLLLLIPGARREGIWDHPCISAPSVPGIRTRATTAGLRCKDFGTIFQFSPSRKWLGSNR